MPLHPYECECGYTKTELYKTTEKVKQQIDCDKCKGKMVKTIGLPIVKMGGEDGKKATHAKIKKRNDEHFAKVERHEIAANHGARFTKEGKFAGFAPKKKKKLSVVKN